MTNDIKIKYYEDAIEYIEQNPYTANYLCNILERKSNHNINNFTELLLFKEDIKTDSAWISGQMIMLENFLDEIDSENSYHLLINERKIFILQLCIEMLK